MKKRAKSTSFSITLISLVMLSWLAFSQQSEIRPATVGQPMPDFSLPAYQGGEVTLSSLKGKNVLLIFPRGFAREARWCHIDNYRYADEKGEVPTPFPILIDGERHVSSGLGIFATEWSGSKADQCISSVFIVDKKGILQFKYIGQNTRDRPSFGYLLKTLERINKGE